MFNTRSINSIATEFVYGGHLLSIGATCILLTVTYLFDLETSISFLLIPYCSSQIVYTYNHFYEMDSDIDSNPERTQYLLKKKKTIELSLLAYFLILCISVLFTNTQTVAFISFIITGGIFYTRYLKNEVSKLVVGFKNFYTAIFWALIVLLVPLLYESSITTSFLYIFIFVFLRWCVNTIFFDIKDLSSDSQKKLKTFPVILGKMKTILLLEIVNILALLPLITGIHFATLPEEALLLGIFTLYGFYYLTHALFLEGKSLRKLSYIIVDAEYIFWPLVVLIGKTFNENL